MLFGAAFKEMTEGKGPLVGQLAGSTVVGKLVEGKDADLGSTALGAIAGELTDEDEDGNRTKSPIEEFTEAFNKDEEKENG